MLFFPKTIKFNASMFFNLIKELNVFKTKEVLRILFLREMLCPQHFYNAFHNIFTTNPK